MADLDDLERPTSRRGRTMLVPRIQISPMTRKNSEQRARYRGDSTKMHRSRARYSDRFNKFAPDPWRTSSPLCKGLSFRYTQRYVARCSSIVNLEINGDGMSGTRRDLLRQVAVAGGYRATYLTMQAMGLLGSAAVAEPLALERGAAHGTKVIITWRRSSPVCRPPPSSVKQAIPALCSKPAIASAAATGPSGAVLGSI